MDQIPFQPHLQALLNCFSSASFYRHYITPRKRPPPFIWTLFRLLWYLLGVFFSVDFLLLARQQPTIYLQYSPVLFFFRRHLLNHSFAFYLIPLFIALGLATDFMLAIQDNGRLSGVLAMLLLENSKAFHCAMSQQFNQLDSYSIRCIVNQIRTYCHLWRGKHTIQFTRRLNLYPGMTTRTRVRLALLQWITERLIQLSLLFIGLALLSLIPLFLLLIVIYEQTFRFTAIFTLVHILLELSLIAFVYYYMLLQSIFIIQLILLLGSLLSWHGEDIGKALEGQLRWKTVPPSSVLALMLTHYRAEHTKLLKVLITTNHNLVSTYTFWVGLPNIIGNIYIISLAYLRPLNTLTFAYILLSILSQVLFLPLVMYLLGAVKILYANQSTLYRAQMALNLNASPNHLLLLREKIKIMYYYELIHSEDRFGFTFGSLAMMNDFWLLQTALLYTSYLMFAFELFY